MVDGNGHAPPVEELPPLEPDELELVVRYHPATGRTRTKFPDTLDLTLAMLKRAEWAIQNSLTRTPVEAPRILPAHGPLHLPRR